MEHRITVLFLPTFREGGYEIIKVETMNSWMPHRLSKIGTIVSDEGEVSVSSC